MFLQSSVHLHLVLMVQHQQWRELNVSLSCSAYVTDLTITWTKGSTQLASASSTSSLTHTINNVTRSESGNYTCTLLKAIGSNGFTVTIGLVQCPSMFNFTTAVSTCIIIIMHPRIYYTYISVSCSYIKHCSCLYNKYCCTYSYFS